MERLFRWRLTLSNPSRGPPKPSVERGGSTRMMSAPQSAKCRTQVGPARASVRSSTRRPDRGSLVAALVLAAGLLVASMPHLSDAPTSDAAPLAAKLRETLRTFEQTRNLTAAQFRTGVASELEARQAEGGEREGGRDGRLFAFRVQRKSHRRGGDRVPAFAQFLHHAGAVVAAGDLAFDVFGQPLLAGGDRTNGLHQVIGAGVFEQVTAGTGFQRTVDVLLGVIAAWSRR